MISALWDVAAAFQFLTRLPLGWIPYRGDTLRRSAKYFPLVGSALGALAALAYWALAQHLPAPVAALGALLLLTLLTGGMHEDGLADVIDACGGWSRERALEIMKDSRVGSYGATAIVFSLLFRVAALSLMPATRVAPYLIAAETLSRFTVLPLGLWLPSARQGTGLGGRIARQLSLCTLLCGAVLTIAPVLWLLRAQSLAPCLLTLLIAAASALYYQRRFGGVTGDCFGATIQLTAIAVYLCGVWRA